MTRRQRARLVRDALVDGSKIVLIVLPAAVWFAVAERPLPLLFAGLLASAVVGYLVGGRLADRRRERELLTQELVVPHWPSCMVPGCEVDAVRFMAGERWYCEEHVPVEGCTVDGCVEPQRDEGLCSEHYEEAWR